MPSDSTDAVLFDLDNTLIPFLGPLRRWARVWAETACPADPDRVHQALVEAALDGTEDTERAVRTVTDRFGLEDTAERACHRACKTYWRTLTPYPGIRAALARLEGADLALGVVTDAPRKRAAVRLAATQLTRFFDVVVTRDDTGAGKTSPRPFRLALDALDAQASATVMVGDWPAYDVRWPRRIGMQAILAGWGRGSLPERARCSTEPWFEAEDPRQIPLALLEGQPPAPSPARQAPLTVTG